MFLELAIVVVLVLLVALCVGVVLILVRPRPTTAVAVVHAKPVYMLPQVPIAPLAIDTTNDVDITRVAPFSVKRPARPASMATVLASNVPLPSLNADFEQEEADDPLSESNPLLQFEDDCWINANDLTGPHDLILTSSAGQTDRGVTRRRNEDAFLIDPKLELYVVADGMGGYAGGDVASRKAVQEVRDCLTAPIDLDPGAADPNVPRRGGELITAIERANAAIHAEARENRQLEGMGTTVVAARFSPRKQRVYIGHVGDSRAYRLRGGELRMLTSDHTLGAWGVVGPLASNIRRAVGIKPQVKVDLIVDKPLPDDLYLFCSDGLTKMVDTDQILKIMLDARDLNRAATSLVAAANAKGGRDNITVVLVRIDDPQHQRLAS